ncbi:PaaX family transcriptional regulator C-terminal domain-containing protein [Planomonospora sp. ID67723]|uniref:PaaX family transcriptional regulator C-terminal domain-containing protein n=1 Tax=Planomonospora sp. ID67723 TaxID=2738134 RepID=UPI0018C42B50|nr:PaaX family transcriptional regulator C-terminal domain-containing protein [Planomonospora sp. ID67723]
MWPLDEVAERYHRLAAVTRPRLERLRDHSDLSEAQRLTIAVELAAAFARAMEPDPLLPPQMLLRPWPGSQARALVAQCWSLLNENADPDSEHTRLFRLDSDVESTAAPPAR